MSQESEVTLQKCIDEITKAVSTISESIERNTEAVSTIAGVVEANDDAKALGTAIIENTKAVGDVCKIIEKNDRRLAFLTILGTIVAVGGVCVGLLTMFVFVRQLEGARAENRPWMTFKPSAKFIDKGDPYSFVLDLDKDKLPTTPILVDLDLSNDGKTYAGHISADATIEFITTESPDFSVYGKPFMTGTTGLIFPGDASNTTHAGFAQFTNGKPGLRYLTNDEYEKLMAGQAYFAVLARVQYSDEWGRGHLTKYCQFMVPKGAHLQLSPKACLDYNYADGDERPIRSYLK